MIQELQEKKSPLVVIELGDFMDNDPDRGPVINPFIVENMVADGMQAMIPGIRELSAWHDFKALLADTQITLISSNLQIQTPEGFEPVGKRTHILEVEGVKIGFIGIMAQEQYDEVKAPEGVVFAIADPKNTIEELTTQLRPDVDLVVVLACMKDKPATELARKLTDVDVLLGGHFSIASERPLFKGDVIVSRCGLRGQYFAKTRLIVSPEGDILEWFGHNQPLDVEKFEPDTTLAAKVEEVAKTARVARLDAIRSRRTSAPRSDRSASRPSATGQPAVKLAASQSPQSAAYGHTSFDLFQDSKYLGAMNCLKCHPAQFRQWEMTSHAKAFALSARTDLSRIVTGFDHPSGYRENRSNLDLTGVQCEVCHGPGSEHVRGDRVTAINSVTCQSCHDNDRSPDWDYAAALDQVKH
jgi:Cytochrome c554 and c-prime